MKFITLDEYKNEIREDKEQILARVLDHLNEGLIEFSANNVVFIALQGSQNYSVDLPESDVDTKLIVTPSLDDLIFNHKPVSTTHVRANNEHTDWKDIRLMFQTFRKQNLNFIEALYTPWLVVNNTYYDEMVTLVAHRDLVAQYCPYNAVKAMYGVAMNKYHSLEHPFPAKAEVLAKYGYDPKQLHHLIRVREFLERYIAGEDYKSCMIPKNKEFLMTVKKGYYNLEAARQIAKREMVNITLMMEDYTKKHEVTHLPQADELLDYIQGQVMKKSIRLELN